MAPGVTYDYYYNESWQLLETRAGSSANPQPLPVAPVLHRRLGRAVVRCRHHDGSGLADYYYQQDANFNVTAVADSGGAVQERSSTPPTAKRPSSTPTSAQKSTQATAIGNTHLYTGRELDAETGLQLNRWRFYSATLGRWVNRDPIQYWGGINLYGYVAAMVTRFRRPLWIRNDSVAN